MTMTALPKGEERARGNGGVGVGTLLGVLVGNRRAILRAADARGTIIVGAALVLAAGLARDYDGEDLLREPWWLAVPFAVSAAIGLLVYALARVSTSGRPTFWVGYRSFLGVMWLIAPTALLYGVPWERMLSPVGAVEANLWTLAAVSAWRVALMARVVAVLTRVGGVAAFFRVMLVAGTMAFVGLLVAPKPLFDFMSGIRQTEAERRVASLAFLAVPVSGLLMLVWLVGGFIALARPGEWSTGMGRGQQRISLGAVFFVVACLIPWLVAMPTTQREQRLRDDAERLLKTGRVDEALAFMSAHERDEFPPQWDPPPKVDWSIGEVPAVLDVVERIDATGVRGWVRSVYLEKFERRHLGVWLPGEERARLDRLMTALPEAPALKRRRAEWMEQRHWGPRDDNWGTTLPSTSFPTTTQQGAAR